MDDQAAALDEIADQLYAMHPDGFAAARDARIKVARAEGQRELARSLGALRRPTLSAWMVNILWRDQRAAMEQLFELAEGLAAAQASASGEELRALIGHRRQFEGALLRTAERLAKGEGVSVSAAMTREVQETLAAALASPAVADEVRTGRLVKPFEPGAFGELAVLPSGGARPALLRPIPIRRPAPAPATPAPGRDEAAAGRDPGEEAAGRDPAEKEAARAGAEAAAGRARAEEAAGRARAEEAAERARAEEAAERVRAEAAARAAREREEAARRVREAKEAVEAAAEALADDARAAAAADELHRALRRRVERLRDQLRELEEEAAAAEATASAAARRHGRSEQAHQAALEALGEAERAVDG